LIEALKYVPNVRLVVAGAPASQDERERLANIARHHGLSDRITFDVRYLSRQEIAAFVNNAIASAYIPIDEDNVGYVTLEAFQAAKPVITTRDAGSVLDIVRENETGLVCDPTPQALGAAMSQLYEDRGKAVALGRNARAALADMNLSWPKTIARLLS
jgi:glycosyltransferase involved in cell wall biosynthesis